MEILDLTTLGSGIFRPVGITINGTNLLWVDDSQEALYSATLDGSDAIEILDLTPLAPGGSRPFGITTNGTNCFGLIAHGKHCIARI